MLTAIDAPTSIPDYSNHGGTEVRSGRTLECGVIRHAISRPWQPYRFSSSLLRKLSTDATRQRSSGEGAKTGVLPKRSKAGTGFRTA